MLTLNKENLGNQNILSNNHAHNVTFLNEQISCEKVSEIAIFLHPIDINHYIIH